MDRRSFLKALIAVPAVLALPPILDPEKLLWVPGEKVIFIPPRSTGNHLVTAEWVARECMKMLENNLEFIALMNKKFYNADITRITNARSSFRQWEESSLLLTRA